MILKYIFLTILFLSTLNADWALEKNDIEALNKFGIDATYGNAVIKRLNPNVVPTTFDIINMKNNGITVEDVNYLVTKNKYLTAADIIKMKKNGGIKQNSLTNEVIQLANKSKTNRSIGIYAIYSLNQKKSGKYTNTTTNIETDYNVNLKNKLGIGIAYKVFLPKGGIGEDWNSIGFEYSEPENDGICISSNCVGQKYEFIMTLGYDIVKSKDIQFWVGPRLNVAYETNESSSADEKRTHLGFAPAIGVYLPFNKSFSLSLDLDYKYAIELGSIYEKSTNQDYDSNGIGQGVSVRFGVDYKFYSSSSW